MQGEAKYKQGDYQGAVAAYDRALQINPNLGGAYLSRGMTRAQGGDKPGAIADFQKAADLFQKQGDKDSYERALNLLKKLQ